jgi:FimV-like protein
MSRGPYPILLVLAMSLPGAVRALGLGDIRIDSALNEPLSAQIDIVGATRDELIALTAKVANREVFQHYGYGADRPAFLATATFTVGMDSQGRPVLNVRSAEPFTDPVVNFLVDLRWNNGELIREYSLLLDPAGFSPSSRLAAAATTMSDRPSPSPDVGPSSAAKANDPRVAAMTQETPSRAKLSKALAETVPADRAIVAQHRVVPRDTLRGIVRRAGARTESHAQRMMIAIFRANPHAFEGNINRLHLGALLTIPSEDEVAVIDAVDARSEVHAQMTAWRLDGRPAASRRVASIPVAAPTPNAAPAHEPSNAAIDALDTDALKGRVQSLEQALDDLHKQLASEGASIQDLKQLTAHSAVASAQPTASAQPAAPAQPAPSIRDSAPAAAAAATAAAPVAASHPVRVEVMHADARSAPMIAEVAPPASPRMSSAGFLGPLGLALALALAGFAYSRRRGLNALAKPPAAPVIGDDHTDTATIAAPAILQPARDIDAAHVSRAAEQSKPFAPVVRAEPAEPAADEIAQKLPSDQTTQELAIDAELLERSYLDALAIDTLGIDTADIAKNAAAAHELADDTATHDTVGLDTVAIDASELDTAVDKADLHTAILDTRKIAPAALNSTNLDYNLLDLDATSDHVQAQHVQMPSQLSDQVVVSERRTNIVDVLKTAIDRDPHRRDLRMKLVETYYSAASMNRRAFLEVVKKLSREREFLSAEDWKQVVKMGKEIAPDDILFADTSTGDLADCA